MPNSVIMSNTDEFLSRERDTTEFHLSKKAIDEFHQLDHNRKYWNRPRLAIWVYDSLDAESFNEEPFDDSLPQKHHPTNPLPESKGSRVQTRLHSSQDNSSAVTQVRGKNQYNGGMQYAEESNRFEGAIEDADGQPPRKKVKRSGFAEQQKGSGMISRQGVELVGQKGRIPLQEVHMKEDSMVGFTSGSMPAREVSVDRYGVAMPKFQPENPRPRVEFGGTSTQQPGVGGISSQQNHTSTYRQAQSGKESLLKTATRNQQLNQPPSNPTFLQPNGLYYSGNQQLFVGRDRLSVSEPLNSTTFPLVPPLGFQEGLNGGPEVPLEQEFYEIEDLEFQNTIQASRRFNAASGISGFIDLEE